ncbi:MAG: hypothetical protein FWE05_00150 [Defluviitaleaceae bacterium]|nr:hypothetical protein [Defluviitaleaceae bacterium]
MMAGYMKKIIVVILLILLTVTAVAIFIYEPQAEEQGFQGIFIDNQVENRFSLHEKTA